MYELVTLLLILTRSSGLPLNIKCKTVINFLKNLLTDVIVYILGSHQSLSLMEFRSDVANARRGGGG